jgi:integrase
VEVKVMKEHEIILRDTLRLALLGRKDNPYRQDAESLLAFLHDGQLTEDALREYARFVVKDRGGKGWSASTAARRLSGAKANVRRLLDLSPDLPVAVRAGIERVLAEMKPPKVNSKAVGSDRVLSPDEAARLVAGIEDRQTALLVEFLLATGCRITEAITILATDCRKRTDHYEVRVQGKGRKERIVYVSKDLVMKIREAFGTTAYLFNQTGTPLERTAWTNRIKRATHRILGRTLSAHCMRHTWATRMIKSGKDLPAVSRYMGHGSVKVTGDMYVHSSLGWEDVKLEGA